MDIVLLVTIGDPFAYKKKKSSKTINEGQKGKLPNSNYDASLTNGVSSLSSVRIQPCYNNHATE